MQSKLLIAALVLLWAMPVAAQDEAEGATEEAVMSAKADAQALMSAGLEALGEGDFAAALEQFRAAYAKYPSPKLMLNIGTSLRQLGRHAEAAEVYEQYLEHPQADPKRIEELKRILQEIDALVGYVTIEVEEGAQVRLDDRGLDVDGVVTVRLDPGEHTVVAEKEGLPPVVRALEVKAGTRSELVLNFTPIDPVVIVESTEDGTTQRVAGLVTGGVGIVGLAIGATFWGLHFASKAEADSSCGQFEDASGNVIATDQCSPEAEEPLSRANTQGTVATAAVIIGGVAFTTGLVLFLTAPDGAESDVALRIGPGSTMLEGRW